MSLEVWLCRSKKRCTRTSKEAIVARRSKRRRRRDWVDGGWVFFFFGFFDSFVHTTHGLFCSLLADVA